MATSFQDREQAFEAKYAHDQEFLFLVTARRDKLMARWAAKECGISTEAGEKLLQAVLSIPDGPGHDPVVVSLVSKAMAAYGNGPSEAELREAMRLCGQQAEKDLLEGSHAL